MLAGRCLWVASAAAGVAAVSYPQPGGMIQLRGSIEEGKPALKVKADGSFKLALFGDMHYGGSCEKDMQTTSFQKTLLSLESPDLVVLGGDATSDLAAPWWCSTGWPLSYWECQSWFRYKWRHFTQALEESSTPYAYALGNHDRIPGQSSGSAPGIDADYSVPGDWILEQDQQNSMSLSRNGPDSIHGSSNSVLPVLGLDDKPAFYVWLLDSSDKNCMGTLGYGCVYPDQVAWYKQRSEELVRENGRVVPGVMFVHIPLEEMLTAWNDPSVSVFGRRGEQICCSSVNTGLFKAIKEVGNIWGVFSGHDHDNDFLALYEGVRIGFGRKSGHGSYGSLAVGSRIFEVATTGGPEEVTFRTWIREEQGAVITQELAVNRTPGDPRCGGTAASREVVRERLRGVTHPGLAEDIAACRLLDDIEACRRVTPMDHSSLEMNSNGVSTWFYC